jgi:hypothetical protein
VSWPNQGFHQTLGIRSCSILGFLHIPLKPFAHKSLPFETLNDFHAHFDPNVVFSNDNVIVANVIDFEQDPELLKSIVKK